MILGRVVGSVHATVINAHLAGSRLLIVRPVDLAGRPSGKPVVGIDRVDAGTGDLVLMVREGGSARLLFDDQATPAQAVILGVVDRVDVAEDR